VEEDYEEGEERASGGVSGDFFAPGVLDLNEAATDGSDEYQGPGGGTEETPFDEGLQIVLMGVIPVASGAVFDKSIVVREGEAKGTGAGAEKTTFGQAVEASLVDIEAAFEAFAIIDCGVPGMDATFYIGNDRNNDYGESDEQ